MEIIHEIASHLPLSSYAALSLTSQDLRWALGETRRLELSHDPDARLELVKLLEKDNEDLWLCPLCSSLHSESMFHTFKQWAPRRCTSSPDHCYFEGGAYIYWHHIHLVSRRYTHAGQRGLDVDKLSWSIKHPPYPRPGGLTESSFRAKFVNGEVLLKCAYMATIPVECFNYYITLCPHLSAFMLPIIPQKPPYNDPAFETVQECRLSHVDTPEKCCVACAPRTRSCCYCKTDWDSTVMDTTEGPRVFIEVWRNLGSGRAPPDSTWLLATKRLARDEIELQPGSVRAAYEGS